VRTGLLVTGAAVAAIGAGVLLASLTFSSGPTSTQVDPVTLPSLGGHAYYEQQLIGVNESAASVTLQWAASQKLVVNVYPSVSCPHISGVCPSGTPIASWWADSGRWSSSGSISFPLFLNLSNSNGSAVSFSGLFIESYSLSSLANPTWNLFLPLIGAVVLIAIGGVAIFLGLFLPTGVYARRGPAAPYLDDEDLEELDDTDIDGDDDGPPPRGPA
jgi:hypothetical protein